MKQLKLILSFLVGAATIVGFGMTIYFQFIHKEIIEVEVKTIDKTQLTKVPDENGLTVQYLYQDSVINNLWKLRYVISNIGTKTIIAKGDNKNIILDCLPIVFKDSIKILSTSINNANFPISLDEKSTNIINLDFKQWKKSEFMDIIVIVESFSRTEPIISMDERDIIDSKIIFSEYKPSEESVQKKLIDYLPKGFSNFLKWTIVCVICIMDIVAIVAINKQLKEDPNTKSMKLLTFIIWLVITIIFSIPLLWIF